ncbi:MAG: response regulator transcription factor [Cyclobacteriaceae bacterium]|jgi:two-component system nitrate/nitrite response regulator NarL|nr:response regulator transcription factor [Cytophagales bacterium]MCZ8329005.1 response regulator transcription factor [Cyclobacteriaceae bacterium]
MKIALLDDHRIVVEGIRNLLEPQHEVVSIFTEANQLFQFLQQNEIDLLITDYQMPDTNGIEVCKKAKAIQPLLKVLLLSMHDETPIVQQAIQAGVNGFLLKSVSRQELALALEKISKGLNYYSAEISKKLIQEDSPIKLSEREFQVLQLILKEKSNKQIADTLFLSERTVETYRKNLYKKANTTTLVGLVKFAYEHHLMP